jgi:hypothetical protein
MLNETQQRYLRRDWMTAATVGPVASKALKMLNIEVMLWDVHTYGVTAYLPNGDWIHCFFNRIELGFRAHPATYYDGEAWVIKYTSLGIPELDSPGRWPHMQKKGL